MNLDIVPHAQEPESVTDWAINANVHSLIGSASIGTGIQSGRRIVRLDGKPLKGSGALSQYFSVLWLTPIMDRLFIEGASARRRFFDRLIFGLYPEHSLHATTYKKALTERSQVLKNKINDVNWLNTIESQIVNNGIALAQGRVTTLNILQNKIKQNSHPSFLTPEITIKGPIEEALMRESSPDNVAEQFHHKLKQDRALDAETGSTSIGPHKTDFKVHHLHTGREAHLCSTGEQKSLLLDLILNNARCQIDQRQSIPVILLDEVTAHMDTRCRNFFFEQARDLGGQIWITGTDRAFFMDQATYADFYNVQENGIIT